MNIRFIPIAQVAVAVLLVVSVERSTATYSLDSGLLVPLFFLFVIIGLGLVLVGGKECLKMIQLLIR